MKSLIISISILLSSFALVNAQTLAEAKELYLAGEYAKALPIMEAEYNLKPTDASLNQWYGACLYETGGDLKKAEECLLVASKKRIRDSHLYLGRIYTKQYRFEEAEKSFASFEKLLKRRGDEEPKAKLEKARDIFSRLKRMVSNTEDIQIIDSIVVAKSDVLDAYPLSPSGGQLDYFNNIFKANMLINSTTYSNEKGTKIYYSQPNEAENLRLLSMEKLLDGYGNEKVLSEDNFGLNGGNTNYPFIMLDGITIYFAANDDESIGGYDLFVSRYNLNNDTYLAPERLGMPFNSPYNDYLMVIDEEKGVGWFASDRFQDKDHVCVYTFIPSEMIKTVESDDMTYKASRAIISSIKDSQIEGHDYSQTIALARKTPTVKQKEIRDFEFVINNNHTYYKFADFKSKSAQDSYYRASQTQKELSRLQTELENLRTAYSKADAAEKRAMTNDILMLERRLEQQEKDLNNLEVQARNQEIKELGEAIY